MAHPFISIENETSSRLSVLTKWRTKTKYFLRPDCNETTCTTYHFCCYCFVHIDIWKANVFRWPYLSHIHYGFLRNFERLDEGKKINTTFINWAMADSTPTAAGFFAFRGRLVAQKSLLRHPGFAWNTNEWALRKVVESPCSSITIKCQNHS